MNNNAESSPPLSFRLRGSVSGAEYEISPTAAMPGGGSEHSIYCAELYPHATDGATSFAFVLVPWCAFPPDITVFKVVLVTGDLHWAGCVGVFEMRRPRAGAGISLDVDACLETALASLATGSSSSSSSSSLETVLPSTADAGFELLPATERYAFLAPELWLQCRVELPRRRELTAVDDVEIEKAKKLKRRRENPAAVELPEPETSMEIVVDGPLWAADGAVCDFFPVQWSPECAAALRPDSQTDAAESARLFWFLLRVTPESGPCAGRATLFPSVFHRFAYDVLGDDYRPQWNLLGTADLRAALRRQGGPSAVARLEHAWLAGCTNPASALWAIRHARWSALWPPQICAGGRAAHALLRAVPVRGCSAVFRSRVFFTHHLDCFLAWAKLQLGSPDDIGRTRLEVEVEVEVEGEKTKKRNEQTNHDGD